MIKHLILENFKNIVIFDTDLDKINVLVGSNNSGKSSVLQGIHFSILAEVIRRKMKLQTVSQQSLLYSPSSDFTILRHGEPYTNYSGNTSRLTLTSDIKSDGEHVDSFSITISKGRNPGNISIDSRPNNPFRQIVTAYNEMYSAYVPGLSGIPLEEKLQTKAVIRHGTANGDANLYLRNILYYIKEMDKLDELNKMIQHIFPNTTLSIPYDSDQDINIKIDTHINGKSLDLELSGTGFLQIVQIMAYVLFFKPKLLLLDEPDEHLHPNNQSLLADALKLLVDDQDVQIILCTHSRHMLSFLDGDAKFIWMKDGKIQENNDSSDMYSMLMDLGALDSYDKVLEGIYTSVFLTEDHSVRLMRKLLEYNNINLDKTLILSYNGCNNVETALQLADFIHRNAPDCYVVIHRDRDFMTENEVQMVCKRINGNKTIPFVTDESDIEAYFIRPEHLACILNQPCNIIEEWLNDLALKNHVKIQNKFTQKRQEIRNSNLYRNDREKCPDPIELFGNDVPTSKNNRLGKFMLNKVREDMVNKFGRKEDTVQKTDFLILEQLQEIRRNID